MFQVSESTFRAYFELARATSEAIRENTSKFSAVPGTAYYIDTSNPARGFCGYAVRPDGELVYVWSTGRGNGDRIVQSAIANGAVYLDCFDGYLVTLYGRHGFEVVDRVPNWTPGGPDVVYMSLPGYADRHGH